ncbi:unnamed protein product [Caenorhabditis angaria]|uniref:T20D4.11-like domain-containing protein n=1 Tax=Caenorhabditis angaria TaxID=860376 RepID=A0A9P1J3C3_9PELO|nr:unnamed protein product [Caenorhabditis angaria]
MLQLLSVFSLLFVPLVHNAAIPQEDNPVCPNGELDKFMKINSELMTLDQQEGLVNVYKSILGTCAKFDNYFNTTKCYPLIVKMKAPMENYCRYTKFESTDFQSCFFTLIEKNTTCYQNVASKPPPLMDIANNDTVDFVSYCKNYFGTNNCMKPTIIESCGENIWNQYKSARTYKDNHCDFSTI